MCMHGRVFEQVHTYVAENTFFQSEQSVRQAKRALDRANATLHEFEKASILSLCPDDVREAVALIPSLQQTDADGNSRFGSEQELQELLEEINSYQA